LSALQNFRGIEADTAEYNVDRPDFIAAMMFCQANDSMDFPPAKENKTLSYRRETALQGAL